MTPEELDRTIEFLIRQQAQFSVDLQTMNRGITELQETTKKLAGVQIEMAVNHRRIADLIEIQAQRLDRHDEALRQYEKWQQQFQKEAQQSEREARKRHEEALERLDRILDKLTPKNPKPN